ncbi:MAG: hypothetical protein ACYC2R_04805 [Burkholderiales bacterium]
MSVRGSILPVAAEKQILDEGRKLSRGSGYNVRRKRRGGRCCPALLREALGWQCRVWAWLQRAFFIGAAAGMAKF